MGIEQIRFVDIGLSGAADRSSTRAVLVADDLIDAGRGRDRCFRACRRHRDRRCRAPRRFHTEDGGIPSGVRPTPHRRVLFAIPPRVAVSEGDFRKVLHPQAGFEPCLAAIEGKFVVLSWIPQVRSRNVTRRRVIPGAELAEAGLDVSEVDFLGTEDDLVVLVAEQGVAVKVQVMSLASASQCIELMPP